MGQGFSITTLSAGSAGIEVPELSDLTYEKSLGAARFLKSIRARHRDGLVAVKVAVKPYPSMKLDKYVHDILRERRLLTDIPNALGYERVLETGTNGFLVRQYLYSSLYDRMSTRPFLENIEKKWLAYQLLCALRDCHNVNVYHGDIKTENTLVTSWNWLYLSDFSSSFKPAFLPEDNPADFSYYFDTSGRRTCYLAPERFLLAGEPAPSVGQVTWAMDIFSAGCVIAELFVESPIFSLSQLFKYRKGDYDPEHAHLSKIEDAGIREMVTHMIQVEPESRYSADEYLNFWRRKAFPEYFYSFLHQYMGLITDPSSGRAPVTNEESNLGEADERIDRIYHDFDKISYFLGFKDPGAGDQGGRLNPLFGDAIIPMQIDIPNNRHKASAKTQTDPDNGTLLFLSLVVSSLRSTARSSARVRACELLLALGEYLSDEAKLDRVLPYIMMLLNDPTDQVKIAAIRSLTQLVALVEAPSPVNAYVFPEYIIPRLQQFVPGSSTKPSPIVRATYAACLATLADTASRFLDTIQAMRTEGVFPVVDPNSDYGFAAGSGYQTLYDVARGDLIDHFEAHTKALLTDSDSSVRRAFLGSVSALCVFFGSAKASEVILSHLNTYLNDRDWMLKCAFFETIVGVATFVGSTSLEEFILPLMVQALADPEEYVVEKVLRSFTSMAGLGLFTRSTTWGLVEIAGPFTMHPNQWIRSASAAFLSSATNHLSPADRRCIITPLVQKYLKTMPLDFAEATLLNALEKPISRSVFELAIVWAGKAEKSAFWGPAKPRRTFGFGTNPTTIPKPTSRPQGGGLLNKGSKNEEDEQWLSRLRNMGLSPHDEWKIVALRDYLWLLALAKSRDNEEDVSSDTNAFVSLKQLGVTPQTVFFDEEKHTDLLPNGNGKSLQATSQSRPHTIADALLDASATIDDSPQRQRKPTSKPNDRSHDNVDGVKDDSVATKKVQRSDANSAQEASNNSSSPASNQNTSTAIQKRLIPSNNDKASSKDSLEVPQHATHHHLLRHRSSAVSLLNKKDKAKALAETSTSSENAHGKLEGPFAKDSGASSPSTSNVGTPHDPEPFKFRGVHTYEGHDPSILRLLDSLYLENFPSDMVEFGPIVTPVSRRQRIKTGSAERAELSWRPQGVLVSIFGEHTAAINRVAVAPDHAFFITGSDDGSVKVWDTRRLERNVAHRARQTHQHSIGAKVKSLCFIENTHCFVSAASDGAVHVVKVECSTGTGLPKYGKLRLLREYQLQEDEHAVWMEHFRGEHHSLLLIATNRSRIVALDLKMMSIVYVLRNPVQYGTPTSFCIDRKHAWLLLGTSHGILCLWDLRFQVRLKAFGLPGRSPIHRVGTHPMKARSKLVCVAGGCSHGEITIWDIEKVQCKEVFRSGGAKETRNPSYEAWKVDNEKPEALLDRFASSSLEPSASKSNERSSGIGAFVTGMDALEDGRESKYAFLISGGSDRRIRFWDMNRIESSMVVSGLEDDEAKPKYSSSQIPPSLTLNMERPAQSAADETVAGGASDGSAKRGQGSPGAAVRHSRSAVISLQQKRLLRSHLDVVMDVALLEVPYGMTVSVDRSGMIYVFS